MNVNFSILNNSKEEIVELKNILTNFFELFEYTSYEALKKNNSINIDVIFVDEYFLLNEKLFDLNFFEERNILVVTTATTSKNAIQMFKYNVLYSIKKPFVPENISLAVVKILEQKIKKNYLKSSIQKNELKKSKK